MRILILLTMLTLGAAGGAFANEHCDCAPCHCEVGRCDCKQCK